MKIDPNHEYDTNAGWLNNWENERITDDDFAYLFGEPDKPESPAETPASAEKEEEKAPERNEDPKQETFYHILFPNEMPVPRKVAHQKSVVPNRADLSRGR